MKSKTEIGRKAPTASAFAEKKETGRKACNDIMGYLELLGISIVFSFGSLLSRGCKTMMSPEWVSLFRWIFGFIFLYIYVRFIKGEKYKFQFKSSAIWIAAIVKSIQYIAENYGLFRGYTYGAVLIWPVQTIFIAIVSQVLFKEKITRAGWVFIFVCLTGIGLICWNGNPIGTYMASNIAVMIAYVIAGLTSAGFTIMQKILNKSYDAVEYCLSVYLAAAGISIFPVLFHGELTGAVTWQGIVSTLLLGVITAYAFLVMADALKRVPLYVVPIIQCSTVIFQLIWAYVIFHEPITMIIITGTIIFIVGVVAMNLEKSRRHA